MLNNRGIPLPDAGSPPSPADVKRQHRKAVMSGDGYIAAPSLPPRHDIVRTPALSFTRPFKANNHLCISQATNTSSPPSSLYSSYAHAPIAVPPVAVHRTGPASPYEAYPSTPMRASLYGANGQARQGEYFDTFASPPVNSYGMVSQPTLTYPTARIDYPALQQRHRTPNGSPVRPQPSHSQALHTPSGKVQIPPPALARLTSSNMIDGTISSSFQVLQSASYLTNPAFGAFPKQLTALGDGSIGLTGLKNLGNTCYMNSMVQCLSATIPLARFLKGPADIISRHVEVFELMAANFVYTEGSYKKAINRQNPLGTKGVLADAVAQLVQSLWSQQYSFLAPVTFRVSVKKAFDSCNLYKEALADFLLSIGCNMSLCAPL